jgi:hypothetical protein
MRQGHDRQSQRRKPDDKLSCLGSLRTWPSGWAALVCPMAGVGINTSRSILYSPTYIYMQLSINSTVL